MMDSKQKKWSKVAGIVVALAVGNERYQGPKNCQIDMVSLCIYSHFYESYD